MPTGPRGTPRRNNSQLLGVFVTEVGEDDIPPGVTLSAGQKLWKCAMEGCSHTKKSKQMQASRWFQHLVCSCPSNQLNNSKRLWLANLSQQKEVMEWKVQYLEREAQRQEQFRRSRIKNIISLDMTILQTTINGY